LDAKSLDFAELSIDKGVGVV